MGMIGRFAIRTRLSLLVRVIVEPPRAEFQLPDWRQSGTCQWPQRASGGIRAGLLLFRNHLGRRTNFHDIFQWLRTRFAHPYSKHTATTRFGSVNPEA